MIKNETYIICNNANVRDFKRIKEFELDLGKSLVNNQQKFIPSDVKIQTHYIFHDEIIYKCGNIGTLGIYNKGNINRNTIIVVNQKDKMDYEFDTNLSMYQNINNALSIFFKKYNKESDVDTTNHTTETKNKEEYKQPKKQFKKLTEEERIAFARNLK